MTTEERERLGRIGDEAALDACVRIYGMRRLRWEDMNEDDHEIGRCVAEAIAEAVAITPEDGLVATVAPDLAAEAEEIVRLVLCDRPDMDAWMAVGARIEELGGPPNGRIRACTEWVESRLREIAGLAPPSPDPAVATELLPCPFCGATPKVIGGEECWYSVRCSTHACPSGPVNFKRREQAVAAWNRRAPLTTGLAPPGEGPTP